jgi:hypothetical protein
MRFRKLSHKSFIGFGYNKDRKVEEMIRIGKGLELCSMYFKCSHISFLPEILKDLKIDPEWEIKKPGTDIEKFYDFGRAVYPDKVIKMKKAFEVIRYKKSKSILFHMNQADNHKAYHRDKGMGK